MISIPVSVAELIDKISILQIKKEIIKDPNQLKNINKEHELLLNIIVKNDIKYSKKDFRRLIRINKVIWLSEEKIRKLDFLNSFFIVLAKKIYYYNDLRAALKKEINLKTNSEIVEEKSYTWFDKGAVKYD